MKTVPEHERLSLYEFTLEREGYSDREREILWLWARGVGARRSARLLGLHESTVREYRRRVFGKLQKAAEAGEFDA